MTTETVREVRQVAHVDCQRSEEVVMDGAPA
jgi:hypothetical protein